MKNVQDRRPGPTVGRQMASNADLERDYQRRMNELCAVHLACRRTVTPANPTIRYRLSKYEPVK